MANGKTSGVKLAKQVRTAIDLFAGAGGLSEGLGQAGFTVMAASEINHVYADTFEANHREALVYQQDIHDLTTKQVLRDTGMKRGELDLLAGGPPCQGFSINAPVRSSDDRRNDLYIQFLRFVEALQPKAVLVENVPGIVSMEKGAVVESIYQAFGDLGYQLHHMILYAAHYGVPQMRWRTIFLGSRRDVPLPQFPYPTHEANGRGNFTGSRELCFNLYPAGGLFDNGLLHFTTVEEAMSDLPALATGEGSEECDYSERPQCKYQEYCRDGSTLLFNHRAPGLHPINMERMKYVKPGGSWRDIPFELLPKGLQRARRSDHTRRYGRLDPKGLSTTIMTKCDPHWGTFFHYNQDRVITVREAARLQSFPDRFRFNGSLVQQYQQVGNAVPPLLGKAIGVEISKALSE